MANHDPNLEGDALREGDNVAWLADAPGAAGSNDDTRHSRGKDAAGVSSRRPRGKKSGGARGDSETGKSAESGSSGKPRRKSASTTSRGEPRLRGKQDGIIHLPRQVNASLREAEFAKTTHAQRELEAQGFTPDEAARIIHLSDRLEDSREVREAQVVLRRLRFTRWLIEHGVLDE